MVPAASFFMIDFAKNAFRCTSDEYNRVAILGLRFGVLGFSCFDPTEKVHQFPA